jgi:SAM-dependent methyltransferase
MIKNDIIKDLQNYYPLFDEGYGTEYERFALNKFLSQIGKKYDISTVLEMPANGVMGIPGLKSMIFAKMGCEVTVSHPSQKFLDDAKIIWNCCGLEADFVKSPWINSHFDKDSFDLVWNFCVYEHFDNPKEVIQEMLRVTGKYILLEIQNIHNIGLPIHRSYHNLINEPWDHGEMRCMDISNLNNIILELNADILEAGATDMPPWPDINIGLKDMLSRKENKLYKRIEIGSNLRPNVRIKENNEIVRDIKNFKKAKLTDEVVYRLFNIWHYCIESKTPFFVKKYFAHHPYIIAGNYVSKDH